VPDTRVNYDEGAQIRKERVHTTMLVELLVSLVFLAMAFAFVQKEDQSITVLQDRITSLKSQLADAQAESTRLRRENADLAVINVQLRDSLARWMDRPRKSIPASEQPLIIPRSMYIGQRDSLANAVAMVKELQKENAELRRRLNGSRKGGSDLPNCTVSAGFLLNIELLESGGVRVSPSWTPGADHAARAIPGITALATGGEQSLSAFAQSARSASEWARQQTVPCGFRVQAVERHADLELYKKQLQTVERYFYVKRQ
jgi:FtsZ-binding cell division protein ZapB